MSVAKKVELKLDHGGIDSWLKSVPAQSVASFAEQIAGSVRAQHPDAEVEVHTYVTDRAAASVWVMDGRAMTWQARDGLLTRAASAAGLEVRSR
jgi:hypothetical protein